MLAEILQKIGFDWRVALSHTVNIAIIFFLLVKFAFPKLKAVIDKRTSDIAEGLKNKDASEKVLAQAKVDAEGVLKEAQASKVEILSEAKRDADGVVASSRDEAGAIIEAARAEKKTAKEEGFKDGTDLFEEKLPKILQVISSKAFLDKVTPEIESEFVKNVFKQVYEK
jgi:F0F1-type ATP synthase membrane subunit b/b'